MNDHAAVLKERIEGHKLADIAQRHGLTGEGVRYIVAREGERQLGRIERDLRDATASGEALIWAIPDETMAEGLAYLTWVIRGLDSRGLNVRIETRNAIGGVGVGLWLAGGDALSERTDQ